MRRAGLSVAAGAIAVATFASIAAAAGPRIQITRWEVNTVQNHKRTVHSGAKVTFCAVDPDYSVSPFFTWSGVPFGAVMTLTVSEPKHKRPSSATKTFEASGQNADTISAMDYGVNAKGVPAGKYSFTVSAGGAKASGSITLVETSHC